MEYPLKKGTIMHGFVMYGEFENNGWSMVFSEERKPLLKSVFCEGLRRRISYSEAT
jgi:hypothetical protein